MKEIKVNIDIHDKEAIKTYAGLVEKRCRKRLLDPDLLITWKFNIINALKHRLVDGLVFHLDPYATKEIPEQYQGKMESTQVHIEWLDNEFTVLKIKRAQVAKYKVYLLDNPGQYNVKLNEYIKDAFQ